MLNGQDKTEPAPGSGGISRLIERYEVMWAGAIEGIRAGNIRPDPVLASGQPDLRRGLTLLARPSPEVRRRVCEFLEELRRLEPEQHYYAPAEFHVTVLSVLSGSLEHERFQDRTERYIASVQSGLRDLAPIPLRFRGMTASSEAVLVQSFFEEESLNRLRDAVRQSIQADGLADQMERRYRLETAHMTVVRFRAPLRNGKKFAAALEQARCREFGETVAGTLTLVRADWYMSRETLETLKRYRLRPPPHR